MDNRRSLKSILEVFTIGSFVFLTVTLLATAILCFGTLKEKETERSKVFMRQLKDSVDLHRKSISEEMWIGKYESIGLRVADIAKEYDNVRFDYWLSDANSNCVYSSVLKEDGKCELRSEVREVLKSVLKNSTSDQIEYNSSIERYLYSIPILFSNQTLGVLVFSLDDPYGFYGGQHWKLYMRLFLPGACFILLIVALWIFFSRTVILRPYLVNLVEFEKNEALGRLSAQVAHDIQSPLAALTSVLENAKGLPLQQHQLLRSAGSRIQNIADDLMRKFTHPDLVSASNFTLVSPVINSIIAEKSVILGAHSAIQFVMEVAPSALIVGIPLSAMNFSRILSNIFNNSIQAIPRGLEGLIRISVKKEDEVIWITIADNGPGVKADILEKINTVGGSYGKQNGAGLGLKSSRELLEAVGGALSFDSTFGVGSTVILKVPTAPVPAWCCTTLDLRRDNKVVVLDDDPSIHLLWKEKLSGFEVTYLYRPEEFSVERFPPDEYRYIFDYEIAGSKKTGLDLIRRYDLASRAILVTSYSNDIGIQEQVASVGAKVLPKTLINVVPIIAQEEQPGVDGIPDLVLIDDDPMTHRIWKIEGKQQGLKVMTVFDEANVNWGALPASTPIYVDYRLKGGISGVQVAERLHRLGFTNLFLSTGEAKQKFSGVPFLKGIVGKGFPGILV